MTVKELKSLLSKFPEEQEVTVATPAHDYWHTTLAQLITNVELHKVAYSGYHQQNVVDEEGMKTVLLLK